MKVAVHTNIFVYAEGLNGPNRQHESLDFLKRLPFENRVVPLNVVGELFNVLLRKAQLAPPEAHRRTELWMKWGAPAPTTAAAMTAAVELAVAHRLAIWDALGIAVAAEAGCGLLLSEDMQDGFAWNGVTVANPFAEPRSPLLIEALGA